MTGSCGLSNIVAWVALSVFQGMYLVEYRILHAMFVFINYHLDITGQYSPIIIL